MANPRFEEQQEIAHALRGIDFPAGREQILQSAKANQSSRSTVATLERLPEHEYETVADVTGSLKRT